MLGIGLVLAGFSGWQFAYGHNLGSQWRALYPSAVPVRVGVAAPELRLQGLSGQDASLAEWRGQVVLVNLWATWCPPCKAEMPTLQAFYAAHRGAGFTVIAINDGEAPDIVQRYVIEQALTFPVWLDPKYHATESAFRTSNLPKSYVIDRVGIVRLSWVGAVDGSTLDRYVAPIIQE
jgi:cytochrome c biogenesis protein CcmG, thiol:disulfide interchange protein DsbE